MEQKNQNPLPSHYPEQESFEEYTNPSPNEITPQRYGSNQSQQPGYDTILEDDDKETAQGYATELGEDGNKDVISDEEDEMIGGYSNQLDDEDEGIAEQENPGDGKSKSPLRPIDANKAPEEWRNVQQNQQSMVGDKKGYDSVSL